MTEHAKILATIGELYIEAMAAVKLYVEAKQNNDMDECLILLGVISEIQGGLDDMVAKHYELMG